MARKYWLVKSEPAKYSWDHLVKDGSTYWDGVRNPQARNNLRAMGAGDLVLYYHSQDGKEVVGIARVTRTAYPDPTTADERWLAVDIEPLIALQNAVSLPEIKTDPALRAMILVKQSRLSVQPVDRKHFERILVLGKTRLPRR